MRLLAPAIVAVVSLLGTLDPAAAQTRRRIASQYNTVTSSDIQRLQDNIYAASRDVADLRGRDPGLASDLQADLDDARDDAIYLKVKLRRNLTVTRGEYTEVRDRIESIRSRARGGAYAGYREPPYREPPYREPPETTIDRPYPAGTVGRNADFNEVPAGTEFDVRLQNSLSSHDAQVEDRFEATTMVDLMQEGRVLVPAGSVMRGVVSSVNKAGHIDRKGSLTVAFDQITIRGRSYPIRATVQQALEGGGYRGDIGKIGAGAGVGAIIGAIIGGAKGALAGVLIGGGGVIAATEGQDVNLPAGTVLRVTLDSPLTVR